MAKFVHSAFLTVPTTLALGLAGLTGCWVGEDSDNVGDGTSTTAQVAPETVVTETTSDTEEKPDDTSPETTAPVESSVPDTDEKTKDETPAPQGPFETLEPNSALPSGEECAKRVRPTPETVPENKPYNKTTGNSVSGETYLSKDIKASDLEDRVDGDFTGTTDEIIQWGACKWGFDEDNVRAQAYAESSMFAGKLGDCGEKTQSETTSEKVGGCASTGLLQVRGANENPVHPGTYPEGWKSTAFNVDYTMAVKRACFEGRETWLNNGSPAKKYTAGDEWGCMGRWFSGDWHDPAAEEYIERVRSAASEKSWENPSGRGCEDWDENHFCSER